jgi:glycerol kinase
MTSLILALDQGTTSSRSILFDRQGTPVASAQREFTQRFPCPGWVEHDPEEIWESQLATIHEVLDQSGVTVKEIAAVGITNQRETTVLWDKTSGRAVAPAIVWQDRRTATLCESLAAAGHRSEMATITGLRPDPYFSGTKLRWLLDHTPNGHERAARGELAFGTIDSWLIHKLTQGSAHITDVTNASRTLLLDIRSLQWSPRMAELLGVPLACLPTIVPSSVSIAEAPQARLGESRIPITGIAGDQQAALFGQSCFLPGMAKNTYGTGCFVLMNAGSQPPRSSHEMLSTLAWQCEGVDYALEGSVFSGGAVVQWLRDGLGLIDKSSDVEALALSVASAEGVCLVPAFTGLGAPYWDPHARGTLLGLTRGSGAGHIARAALESIAFQSADVLAAMQQDAAHPIIELRVDGGASRNDTLMQWQADILNVPVIRPSVTETTALGAAFLAGLGAGYWSSKDELSRLTSIDRRFEPSPHRQWVEARQDLWKRAVERSLHWAS